LEKYSFMILRLRNKFIKFKKIIIELERYRGITTSSQLVEKIKLFEIMIFDVPKKLLLLLKLINKKFVVSFGHKMETI